MLSFLTTAFVNPFGCLGNPLFQTRANFCENRRFAVAKFPLTFAKKSCGDI